MMTDRSLGYPEYRATAVLWEPLAPKHWQTVRMDALAAMIRDQIAPKDMDGRPVFHYSIPNIQDAGSALLEDGSTVASSKFKVEMNDVLYSKLNPRKETIAVVEAHLGLVVASSEFVVLRPCKQDQNFLRYLLRVPSFKDFVCAQVESATRSHQRINPSVVSKLIVAAPPPEERSQIAKFLDYETAKIDALIEKQQQLIALLKEKRQAVISHAVTKGLNPDAPMRDSGVEWLGEVPAHWEVSPLGYLTPEVTVGIVITPAKYYIDVGVPCLRSLNVRPGYLQNEELVYISPASNDLHSKSKIYFGDVVIVRTGQPGTAAIVGDEFDGCNCIDLIIVRRSHRLLPEFLVYQMNSNHVVLQVSAGSGGAIQQHFNVRVAKKIKVLVPSEDDQLAVIRFLDEQSKKFDALIAGAESAAALLQERRTALISAAVTGKIDVRGWKAPRAEAEAEVA